jgi:hypothetical protein
LARFVSQPGPPSSRLPTAVHLPRPDDPGNKDRTKKKKKKKEEEETKGERERKKKKKRKI